MSRYCFSTFPRIFLNVQKGCHIIDSYINILNIRYSTHTPPHQTHTRNPWKRRVDTFTKSCVSPVIVAISHSSQLFVCPCYHLGYPKQCETCFVCRSCNHYALSSHFEECHETASPTINSKAVFGETVSEVFSVVPYYWKPPLPSRKVEYA